MSTRYTVHLEDDAKNDLRAIRMYIATVLREPGIANKLYARLKKEILSLERMPERIKRMEDEPWHSRGFRMLMVGHYAVFFICDGAAVHVLRVMYGGMDISKQLDK